MRRPLFAIRPWLFVFHQPISKMRFGGKWREGKGENIALPTSGGAALLLLLERKKMKDEERKAKNDGRRVKVETPGLRSVWKQSVPSACDSPPAHPGASARLPGAASIRRVVRGTGAAHPLPDGRAAPAPPDITAAARWKAHVRRNNRSGQIRRAAGATAPAPNSPAPGAAGGCPHWL